MNFLIENANICIKITQKTRNCVSKQHKNEEFCIENDEFCSDGFLAQQEVAKVIETAEVRFSIAFRLFLRLFLRLICIHLDAAEGEAIWRDNERRGSEGREEKLGLSYLGDVLDAFT